MTAHAPTEDQIKVHAERFGASDRCPFCRAWYYVKGTEEDSE